MQGRVAYNRFFFLEMGRKIANSNDSGARIKKLNVIFRWIFKGVNVGTLNGCVVADDGIFPRFWKCVVFVLCFLNPFDINFLLLSAVGLGIVENF